MSHLTKWSYCLNRKGRLWQSSLAFGVFPLDMSLQICPNLSDNSECVSFSSSRMKEFG